MRAVHDEAVRIEERSMKLSCEEAANRVAMSTDIYISIGLFFNHSSISISCRYVDGARAITLTRNASHQTAELAGFASQRLLCCGVRRDECADQCDFLTRGTTTVVM